MIRQGGFRSGAVVVLLGAVIFASLGCSKSPLYSELPRTPYGRYQALRGGEPPEKEPDSFGNMRPALRARLSPKDRP